MSKTTVSMTSVTLAFKAKRILESKGFSCSVKKAPKISVNGCTHILEVSGTASAVTAVLDSYNIKYGKILRDGMFP